MNIKIDESSFRSAPTILQRITYTVGAMFAGAIFLQILLFAFFPTTLTPISIVLYIQDPLFIAYMLGCGVAGWIFGRDFMDFLLDKGSDWWDIWGLFR